MKATRFSETQILEIPTEQESDTKLIGICRKHGISDAPTFPEDSKA